MLFAFAVCHGLRPGVPGFSIARLISAGARSAALALVAICGANHGNALVQFRGCDPIGDHAVATAAIPPPPDTAATEPLATGRALGAIR
jgi:hypothetical protein